MRSRFHTILDWLGWGGLAFVAFAALYLLLGVVASHGAGRIAALLGMLVAGIWVSVRLLRRSTSHLLWRLRNRLYVTYLFIAALPILLVAVLVVLGGISLVNQLAVYMVTSQLDRRIETLDSFTESVVRNDPASRTPVMTRSLDLFYRDRFPGIEILLREGGREVRYPEEATEATIPAPKNGWKKSSGVLVREGKFFLWSFDKLQNGDGDVTVIAPLSGEFLGKLVPNLGQVDIGGETSSAKEDVSGRRATSRSRVRHYRRQDGASIRTSSGTQPYLWTTGINPPRKVRNSSSPSGRAFPPCSRRCSITRMNCRLFSKRR